MMTKRLAEVISTGVKFRVTVIFSRQAAAMIKREAKAQRNNIA